MTEQEGIRIVRALFYGALKVRSRYYEVHGPDTDEIKAYISQRMHPWLIGPKSLLPALEHTIDVIDAGKPLDPLVVFNFLNICQQWEPTILVAAQFQDPGLPILRSWAGEDVPAWIAGWAAA